jgi:hypothetical protein
MSRRDHIPDSYSGQIVYQWERDADDIDDQEPVEIKVSYTAYRSRPATWESPAEGGDCETWGYSLADPDRLIESVVFVKRDPVNTVAEFTLLMETDKALRESVEQECRDDAAERCQPPERERDER